MRRACSVCGAMFDARTGRSGAPRKRCDGCRTNHEKIRGKEWQRAREAVLKGNPACAVPGCSRPATTVDHIVPLSAGGHPYHLGNLQPMCSHHNSSKASRVRNDLPPISATSTPSIRATYQRGRWPAGECAFGHGPKCPGGPIPHSKDWWS